MPRPDDARATLSDRASADGASAAPEVRTAPASFAQQRLWFLDQLHPQRAAYNVYSAFRLTGPLSLDTLAASLNAIVARHESLRTTFPEADSLDGVRQSIASSLTIDVPLSELPDERTALQKFVHDAAIPFDLHNGPLIRASLVRIATPGSHAPAPHASGPHASSATAPHTSGAAPPVHLLLVTTHHIVADGWSMTLLFQELAAIYPTLQRRHIDALPTAPCGQYAEYVEWQRARHRQGAFDEGLEYWTHALAEPPVPLDLAADRPRPAQPTSRGGSLRLRISRDLTTGLKEIGRTEGASLFTTLAAAFALLLRRYSGASTLAIGTPMANRLREQDETCIGFFANTLVLRCDLTGNPTFRDLLRRIRAATLEAFSHQDSPFEQVVERVNPARDSGVNPLFQVMLALQPADAPWSLPGVRVEPIAIHNGTSKFDLLMELRDRGDDVDGQIEFNSDIFDDATVAAMRGAFWALLASVIDDPSRPIDDYEALDEDTAERVLHRWNATHADFGDDTTVVELFTAQAERTPDAVALLRESSATNDAYGTSATSAISAAGAASATRGASASGAAVAASDAGAPGGAGMAGVAGGTISYRALHAHAERLAARLRALGAGPDRPVGVCLDRSFELIASIIGILRSGAPYVPLDSSYPADRLRMMLDDSGAAIVLTDSARAASGLFAGRMIELVEALTPDALTPDAPTPTAPSSTSPISTPPISTPPISTPPISTPPISTPPISRWPLSTSPTPEAQMPKAQTTHGVKSHAPTSEAPTLDVLPRNETGNTASESDWTRIDPDSLAYVIYTSGSTGRPKGVAMPHRPLCNLIRWQIARSRATVGTRTLQFTPISFDVSFQEIFSTLCTGGTLVLVTDDERRDPSLLLARLDSARVERLFAPFVALKHLAEAAEAQRSAPTTLREVITAGEQLVATPALMRLFSTLDGCTLDNQYGPSETHVATAHMLEGPPERWPLFPPIGRPIANTKVHILDAAFRPVPIGATGELCIGGVALARGYLDKPEQTRERFVPDPFLPGGARLYRTGDKARYRADGTLEFLGRLDDQVKIRGYRVEPGEIETVLASHPAVREAAVVVTDAGTGDKRLVAYVVAAEGQTCSPRELRELAAARLPDYMVPAFFALVKSLPLTPSGKLDRRTLSRLDRTAAGVTTAEATGAVDATGVGTTAVTAAARDEVERTLQTIWQDVLGVAAIGIHDDFFSLGGHSLIAAELCSRMGRAFDLPLPVSLLFRSKTIAELAAIVRDRRQLAPQTIVALNDSPPATDLPPLFLIHSLGGGIFHYRDLATRLATDQRVYGIQAVLDHEVPASAASIVDTAVSYLREIRRVQPHGPYLLGGWSSGGTIALEIAQRLTALGESVPCIIILDSAPYNTADVHNRGAVLSTLRTLSLLTLNVPLWVLDDLIKGGGARILTSRITRRVRSLIERASAYMRGASTVESEVGGFLDLSRVSERQRAFMQQQYRALREYTPRPYAGRVILYRARTHPLFHLHESDRAWRAITATLDVKFIAGTHLTIVKPPLVSAIAEDLKTRLRGLGPAVLRTLTSTLPALAPFAG